MAAHRVSLLCLAGALIIGVLAVPATSAIPTSSSASFSVSLQATPSYGTAPLFVQFTLSVTGGVPTGFNWSFGDRTYLNGSNASDGHPSHLYSTPGTYTAHVTVWNGTTSSSTYIGIHVIAGALAVEASAKPAEGIAPLTVTFTGYPSGGTATYVGFNWTFGDGAVGVGSPVQYTYREAGHFYAQLTVRDSNGSQTVAGVWVNVSARSASPTLGLSAYGAEVWAGIGFGTGVTAALLVFPVRAALLRRRQAPQLVHPVLTGAVPGGTPAVSEEPEPSVSPIAESPTPSGDGSPANALRISQRVLVHLAEQGTLGPHEIARQGLTQAGMSAALGIRQNALTNVLRRLTDAGVIETDVRHVQGRPRRLKVYRLTPRGSMLARELRHRPRAEHGDRPG